MVTLPDPADKQHKRKKDRVWSAVKEKADVQFRESWEPRKNKKACGNYTQVFLCDARLYIFSEKYSIEPLQQSTTQNLRQ
jgi:hypothetical protein